MTLRVPKYFSWHFRAWLVSYLTKATDPFIVEAKTDKFAPNLANEARERLFPSPVASITENCCAEPTQPSASLPSRAVDFVENNCLLTSPTASKQLHQSAGLRSHANIPLLSLTKLLYDKCDSISTDPITRSVDNDPIMTRPLTLKFYAADRFSNFKRAQETEQYREAMSCPKLTAA